MRPISSFNMLNVIGGASPAGLSLSANAHKRSLQVHVDAKRYYGGEQEDSGAPDLASISDKAKQMADEAERAGLPSDELEEVARVAEKIANDPATRQAKEDLATIRVGEQVSQNLQTNAEQERIRDLEERDKQVRQREEAHVRAAGLLAQGGPKYRYEIGPDGKRYAVEGHTEIKVKEGRTPEERLKNARQAERAAQEGGASTPQSARVLAEARQEADKAKQEIEEENAKTQGREEEAGSPRDRLSQKVADTYREQEEEPLAYRTRKLD